MRLLFFTELIQKSPSIFLDLQKRVSSNKFMQTKKPKKEKKY
jgi:hypothetical protein